MSNTVEIAIVARDLVSPIINAISGKFGALDVAMGGIRAGFGLLSGDIQAEAQGIQTMIGGVQKLASEFGEAAKIQTKFLADAGSFSAISGLGLQQAKGFMSEFNIELAKMAASLPGATKDYTDLANSIGSTLVRGFNVKSTDGLKSYRDQLESIVKTVTILGQSQGIGANDNALFVNRFLGGASVSELRLYQFAERNSAFLERVKAELKAMGKAETDFKGLSVDTKARILNKVSSSLVTPELIAELQGTADAMLETIKTNISDPYIGALGFLRKIPSAGNFTVMDSFTKFLGSWMDLGNTISIMASHVGITIDPLKPLVDVLDFLTNFGDRANDFLGAIDLTKGFQGVDLTGMFVGLFEGLAGWFNSGIAGLTGFIWNLDISQLGIWVSGLFNSYLVGMTTWLNSVDWANLGRSLGLGFIKLVQAGGS